MVRTVNISDEKVKATILDSLRREIDRIDSDWDKIKNYKDSVGTNALGVNGFSFSVEYDNPPNR